MPSSIGSASSAAGGGVSTFGAGLGRLKMGVATRSNVARFLSMSEINKTAGCVFGVAACRVAFSFNHARASLHSCATFSKSAASMWACASSPARDKKFSANAVSAAIAPGRSLSSLSRPTMGSPIARSSSSLFTYTPLVSSSPSSYNQSSVAFNSALKLSRVASSTYSASCSAILERMLYTYSSTAFLRSFVSSITLSCSAMSYSSLVKRSTIFGGKPPTWLVTGTSVFLTFFLAGGFSSAFGSSALGS